MRIIRSLTSVFFRAAVPLAEVAASPAGAMFSPIEVRAVAEAPAGGPMLILEGTGRTVEVGTMPLPSLAGFASVGEVALTEGKPGFTVNLTSAGAARLTAITTANVGQTLAIIVTASSS